MDYYTFMYNIYDTKGDLCQNIGGGGGLQCGEYPHANVRRIMMWMQLKHEWVIVTISQA